MTSVNKVSGDILSFQKNNMFDGVITDQSTPSGSFKKEIFSNLRNGTKADTCTVCYFFMIMKKFCCAI